MIEGLSSCIGSRLYLYIFRFLDSGVCCGSIIAPVSGSRVASNWEREVFKRQFLVISTGVL